MAPDATTEATILSQIHSSTDLTGIHRLFTAHLHPFIPLLKPSTTTAKKHTTKSSKPKHPVDSHAIRALAKQFISFLHKSLSFIPKRLSESPRIPQTYALELLDAYRLCLDCLDLIAPELAGKPHSVLMQRIRYVHCLENWELYSEAEAEGLSVLDSFNEIVKGASKGKSRKSKTRLVPELDELSVDREFAVLILEIVVTLVKCALKRRSKTDSDYWRVISLVNESEPWFKVLDGKDYEKFHHFLVTNLHITALLLIGDMKCFDVDLICEFSLVTFREYKKSSSQDQMYKFVHKICSSIFSQRDELSTDIIIDVLKYVWDFMAADCKVGVEKTIAGFLELVCYCANKCHGATMKLCGPVAEHLNRLADAFQEGFPFISSILRLYVAGLLASSTNNETNGETLESCRKAPLRSALRSLFDNKERLQQVSAHLNFLKGHSDFGGKDKDSYPEGMPRPSSYWEALNYFCQSLADSIYSNRIFFFSEADNAFSWDDLSGIIDVFHQFSYMFLQSLSATERERETSGDNHRVISAVVVAALMLSFKTNQNVKESTLLVKHVISTEEVTFKRLKYLYVSLNNLSVILNREKRLKEGVKALKLCCKASWVYLVNLCKMHADKSHVSHEDLSEKAIADFIEEASEKIAFLLELNQESMCKINGIIEESFKCWSVAESHITTLPTPASLVKKWVKVEYLMSKNVETEHGTPLYSLLSSTGMSTRALGKLLEEELVAYNEKSRLNPRFCSRMQMKIIDILLEEIYVTKETNIKKSRILIEKGKLLRAHGLARLDDCIQCLSDAILTLKPLYDAKKSCSSLVHHLLIHAYLMHALCTQEAVDFIQDIHSAVKLCLSPDHNHADEQCEDALYLWYQLIDLLSVKGYLDIHPSLYDVVIKLFNQKNIPLAKTVSELWKSKRLSHALCVSPVNHMFIKTFSRHQSQLCNSAEFWRMCTEELNPLVVGFHHIDNEIKQAASDLISHVPLSSCPIFLSSHLYYDLSKRLISSGQMIEALLYAKEAHRLRGKLLQQKFEYSVEKVTQTFDENGKIIEKSYHGIQTFRVKDLVTKVSCDYEGCVLTPWNVLSCYLESILQVGVIQEILGNGSEAEMLLQWGRNVSQFQGLPLFEISFSSTLGKLYRKQKLWCLAEKELACAKKTLTDNRDIISCERCVCMLEISINQHIADLFLSSSCNTGELLFTKKLFNAKSLYKLALDKLNLSEWWTSNSMSEEARAEQVISRESSNSSCASNLVDPNDSISSVKLETKIEPKRSRRTKKEQKPVTQRQDMVGAQNRRITRSTYRSLVETREIAPDDRLIGSTAGIATEHMSTSTTGSDHNVPDSDSEAKCFVADLESDITSLCNKMNCWHCFHIKSVHCSSLNTFINMNWELVYRKLSLRLLISIGKFSSICGNYQEANKLLLQSVSILFRRNSFCSKYSSCSLIFLIESTGKQFPGDVLAVERAALLYYICWFALRCYPYQGTSNICCELSCIGTTSIVSLLKLAFILCREISRLLAVLYVLSTSVTPFSLSPSDEGSESQWASFFHQASLGTHLNQQIHAGMVQKRQSPIASDEGSLLPNSISSFSETLSSLRLAPDACEDLEEFVLRFFQGLPATPVICISLVAGADAGLLTAILHCSPTIPAWILLSHLSSDNQHVVLLPVYTTLEEASDDDGISTSVVFNCKEFVKQWQCPWVSSVIDEIAPVFRHVLEGNYYSSSDYFLEYIKENTSLWWMQRNRLDECLNKFLRDMEDLWLGTWKYLLLGKWPDHNYLDSIQKNLFGDEELSLQHIVSKKCYVGLSCDVSTRKSVETENTMQLLYKRMFEPSHKFDQVECESRNPIILVLDFEVQMLPWENLPILRNQEVYRMPSVSSIFATIDRCCQNQKQTDTTIPAFPLIDPLDSYYLLNPDGDLSRTQIEFESWFKDQNIEGRTGTVPTIDELSLALKNHDLFIYFGHGSGTQYIPGHEIQKLESCAATLLMGCSSGSLYLKGSYMPQGAPISYLLAGSPVIIANLWEVTDKDIDRFGKAMLNEWLRERADASAECTICACKSLKCKHSPRIGSFMGQARDACNLGFLIGASPVCYGVPTGIIKRKNV
ncbi:hypothetical protein ACJIZ3_015733 [Penstemon smallii]|uniref:separase n=1 Tax=Penstemon smallii TaxID=265156 RepID=A0ABD3RNG1_9LAMI